MGIAGKGR